MERHKIVYIITSVAASILLAAATAGPSWIETSSASIGIFQYCYKKSSNREAKCVFITFEGNDNLNLMLDDTLINIIRVLALIAVLTSLFGAVFSFISLCTSRLKGGILLITAAVCAQMAAGIFTYWTRELVANDNISYGWSYAFEWVGMVIAVVAGSLGNNSN